MRLRFVLPAALAIAACTAAAHADTVTFSYDTPNDNAHSSGNGSFTYSGPLSSISLVDLTSFNFNLSIANGASNGTFDLADLTSFSATVTNGAISALTLQTQFVNLSGGSPLPEDFIVTGLANGQAQNDSNSGGETFVVDTGAVTTDGPGLPPAATPEPSSLALLGTSFLALAGVARRRIGRS